MLFRHNYGADITDILIKVSVIEDKIFEVHGELRDLIDRMGKAGF